MRIGNIQVSIPYRHAKNFSFLHFSFAFLLSFQFLIGTLKTLHLIEPEDFADLFQFLIGTLKTLHLIEPEDFADLFQFLIGTLKTSGSFYDEEKGKS